LEKKKRKEVKIREKRFESIFIIGKIENITYKIGKIRSLFILSQYFSKLLEISFKNDHQLFGVCFGYHLSFSQFLIVF